MPDRKDSASTTANESRRGYKFDKWMAASLIAIVWIAVLNLQLSLAIVASLVASWAVAAVPKLEAFTAPVLFIRTIISLYAFGWFVEFYTGLTPWLSIPIGLVLVAIVASATSDPYHGIKKDKK